MISRVLADVGGQPHMAPYHEHWRNAADIVVTGWTGRSRVRRDVYKRQVLTGEELDALTVRGPGAAGMFSAGLPMPSFSVLATDKVRLVGDPVVLVVAESRYLAEDACELVVVDYEELPAVITQEQALDPAGPPIFEDLGSNVLVRSPVATFGDVEGAFARADRVVRAELRQHRHLSLIHI